MQTAADKHLFEKSQIRDTLGLLRIYHKSNDVDTPNETTTGSDNKGRRDSVKSDSPRKRLKANQDIVG